jgi:hypothetical protein
MQPWKHSNALKWAISLLLSFVMANASAARHVEQSSETTPLEVVVSHPTDKTEAEAGIIVITITNHSSKSLLLPRIRTALGGFEPRRQRGLLVRVINPAGKAARYTGTFISFSESTPRRDRYIRIDPGQTAKSTSPWTMISAPAAYITSAMNKNTAAMSYWPMETFLRIPSQAIRWTFGLIQA